MSTTDKVNPKDSKQMSWTGLQFDPLQKAEKFILTEEESEKLHKEFIDFQGFKCHTPDTYAELLKHNPKLGQEAITIRVYHAS